MLDAHKINGLSEYATPEPGTISGKDAAPVTRKHLTPAEVERLRKAARKGFYGHRDETLVMLMAAHGLRCSEAIDLRWADISLEGRSKALYVRRRKNGRPSTHPLCGPEVRALKQLERDWPDNGGFVFVSERGGPMTDSNVRKLVSRLGREAGLPFPVHPHMLRHAAGYRLVNQPGVNLRQIQDFLGHVNVTNTQVYTALSEAPFANFEPAFRD